MIEIYLFVNPLGKYCLEAEKKMLNFIEEEDKKIQFRFVPFLNLNTINHIMDRQRLPKEDITIRNTLFSKIYSASLDYKAIQLQGQKKARSFMLKLQEIVSTSDQTYSQELVEDIIVSIGADLEMFQMDRNSDLAKKSFESDQQIAHEMGIKMHPSAVIFNYSCNRDFGVLVENCLSIEVLHSLCKVDEESCDFNYGNNSSLNSQRIKKSHLHLL